MDLATFETEMTKFIALIEKKDTKSYYATKKRFVVRLADFEADIKQFKHTYSNDELFCAQLKVLNDLLKQLYEATAFVGENESIFRSDDLHKQLLGKMPWIRQAMSTIHTMLNK